MGSFCYRIPMIFFPKKSYVKYSKSNGNCIKEFFVNFIGFILNRIPKVHFSKKSFVKYFPNFKLEIVFFFPIFSSKITKLKNKIAYTYLELQVCTVWVKSKNPFFRPSFRPSVCWPQKQAQSARSPIAGTLKAKYFFKSMCTDKISIYIQISTSFSLSFSFLIFCFFCLFFFHCFSVFLLLFFSFSILSCTLPCPHLPFWNHNYLSLLFLQLFFIYNFFSPSLILYYDSIFKRIKTQDMQDQYGRNISFFSFWFSFFLLDLLLWNPTHIL